MEVRSIRIEFNSWYLKNKNSINHKEGSKKERPRTSSLDSIFFLVLFLIKLTFTPSISSILYLISFASLSSRPERSIHRILLCNLS